MGDFQTLVDRLDPDPRIKGRQFEEICKWFLENDPTRRDLVAKVWLWSEWEHAWGIDAGIDLVVKDVDGHLWAVQSKAYDPSYSVSKADVDKFLAESSRKQFSYRLLIATTDKLHHIARKTINAQEKHVGFIGRADLLTAAVNWPSSPAALRPAKPRKPAKPRPYQRDAIKDVVKGFKTADRGQLTMACGTGKTLTSLFINEKLAAERTLVLLPSLSLLKQTLSEWRANAATPFRALPVCSDESVADTHDAPVAHTSELGLPDVTTDPATVAGFLRRPGRRVVFATYQSSPQIAAAFALGGVPEFDLALADEAHRVAGDESTSFATILDADLIKAKRRLFMTATPRYFTGRVIKAAQEREMVVASMDDHTRFGPVFHRLSFGEAIGRGLLTDYQVAVIAVDTADETYRMMAENAALLKRDGKPTDGHTLASQVGLAKAMRRYDLRRVISFHSRVARARQFAAEMPDVLGWMSTRQRPSGPLWTGVATGEMTAGERHLRLQRLRHLEDGERGLLTNARCLSEGVDVPTLDGVAFIDPKGSEVDIIQAVGRAIRLADDKTIGTIVIPVYIDSTMDPDAALEDSSFKAVWRVVKALRAHDEELAEEIDNIRREMGRRGGKPRIPGKIHLDVPRTVDRAFADAFDVRLIERTAQPWEFWLGLLGRFVEEFGHARVPRGYQPDGVQLDNWVTNQRAFRRRGVLPEDRQRQLEQLPGWVWDPHDELWEANFRELYEFAEGHGHSRVPRSNEQLGSWVLAQRQKFAKGTLEDDRRRRLEALPGWTWDPFDEQWEAGFTHLLNYVQQHGNARIPGKLNLDGFSLGAWASTQRQQFAKGKLDGERRRRLEALPGWTWRGIQFEQWEQGFTHLSQYATVHGTARTSGNEEFQGFALGRWVSRQRVARTKGQLSAGREARLEELPGWVWDDIAARWEEGFEHLAAYVADHQTSRVPISYRSPDGFRLGSWINVQRNAYAAGTLTDERCERLQRLADWSWNARLQLWEDGYDTLRRYTTATGSAAVPYDRVFEGFALGKWVTTQRRAYTEGKLSKARRERLMALSGWVWDVKDEQWAEGLAHLLKWVETTGSSADLPREYMDPDDGYQVGHWVNNQRSAQRRGKLSEERQRQLEGLPDWSWDPKADSWEKKFELLGRYAATHGDSRVPPGCEFEGVRLSSWCTTQRAAAAKGRLSEVRRRRLEQLPGWVWDTFDAQWEDAYAALCSFVKREGTALVPQAHREDGFTLGSWVTQQRGKWAKGKLSPERQRRLEDLPGWSWNPASDRWETAFQLLCAYQRENGTVSVPGDRVYGGFKLGDWMERQRSAYRKGTLDEDRLRRLEAIDGWQWTPTEDKWERGFSELVAYAAEHGDALVPTAYVVNGYRLGSWVNTQRLAYFDGTMLPERCKRIEGVPGWSWDPHADSWERAFNLVVDYVREHGTARIPDGYRAGEFGLGAWVGIQRSRRRKGTLPAEREKRLGVLPGWIWDHSQAQWDDSIAALRHYLEEHGDTRVPQGLTFDGVPLGNWVARQRREYAKGTLAPDRRQQLEQVPTWSWVPHNDEWERRFALLEGYAGEHRDTRVPASYKAEDGTSLGGWVRDQRDSYRQGTLKPDRAERLMALPHWTWDALPKGPRRRGGGGGLTPEPLLPQSRPTG